MKIIERLRNLWWIAEKYGPAMEIIVSKINELSMRINERTTVHTDIHMKTPSLVIVIGEYRNRDYVRAFHVEHKSFHDLIEHLNRIEPNARVGRMDMIPHIEFSAVYPHKRF